MDDARKTDISTVLFPVEQRAVFLLDDFDESVPSEHSPPSLLQYSQIPRFRAIVDIERRYTFAVVGPDYRLVTNAEAMGLAERCFCRVFSLATVENMEVFNITMPKTRSFCHIDYIHEDGEFEPWQNDKWVPYLRVTNSYNRTKPLRFDLGFCRWICTNGMIFGSKSISFRYLHTRGAVEKVVEFETTFGELKQVEKEFIEQIHNLKRYYIPQEVMLGLACKVFDISVTAEDLKQPRRHDQLMGFRDRITELSTRYVAELGPNGYAALNVLTDFASRPCYYISPEGMIDRLQRRSGEWIASFLAAIEQRDFDFDEYLGDYGNAAEVLAA